MLQGLVLSELMSCGSSLSCLYVAGRPPLISTFILRFVLFIFFVAPCLGAAASLGSWMGALCARKMKLTRGSGPLMLTRPRGVSIMKGAGRHKVDTGTYVSIKEAIDAGHDKALEGGEEVGAIRPNPKLEG
ncbi:hypothetical protein E2C01_050313 [Portunus trituberculatus]|uniref:Uncharacterized protein n=1 Tax=Portunus trituberculatus TaxID=210409 RepID=A0A5B7GG35_PORTR|nr:hypothetical protein [Portunus trituberculatus]